MPVTTRLVTPLVNPALEILFRSPPAYLGAFDTMVVSAEYIGEYTVLVLESTVPPHGCILDRSQRPSV